MSREYRQNCCTNVQLSGDGRACPASDRHLIILNPFVKVVNGAINRSGNGFRGIEIHATRAIDVLRNDGLIVTGFIG